MNKAAWFFVWCTAIPTTLVHPARGQTCQLEFVSQGLNGVEGNGDSTRPSLSSDGRYAAFESSASNLVPGDTNGWRDVFRFDRVTRELIRISITTGGGQANQDSGIAQISANGDRIAFGSSANLDPADTGVDSDVYLHDVATGQTTLVSKGLGGVEPNASCDGPAGLSGDGRYVAYLSDATNLIVGDTNNRRDVFVYDMTTGVTERVSLGSGSIQPNGKSGATRNCLSHDGRYVAFESKATNLIPFDANGNITDIFVHDRQTKLTEIVSISQSGAQTTVGVDAPEISPDGRFVVFRDYSNNIVPAAINGTLNVLFHDRMTGETSLVSISSSGMPANKHSAFAGVSKDGRFVAFSTDANNLVSGDTNADTDVFVHDLLHSTTRMVSMNAFGEEGDGGSHWSTISSDGRSIGFDTQAKNLVVGIFQHGYEVLAEDCGVIGATNYCTALVNSQGCTPAMSFSGTPSATSGAGFDLSAAGLINQKAGVLLYGKQGWTATPYFGGTLCVLAPLRRTPIALTGGSGGADDCTGTLHVDFNAWVVSGADPGLVAGEAVHAQFMSRDPAAAGSVCLTDAVALTLGP